MCFKKFLLFYSKHIPRNWKLFDKFDENLEDKVKNLPKVLNLSNKKK